MWSVDEYKAMWRDRRKDDPEVAERDFVIYHDDADGYCSAGLVSLLNYIRDGRGYVSPVFFPIGYGYGEDVIRRMGEKASEKTNVLYILDFSFPAETVGKIVEELCPKKAVYLDHHATSREEMSKWGETSCKGRDWFWTSHIKRLGGESIECFTANNNRECGASLTWKHVKKVLPEIKAMPCVRNIEKVVRLCKDYDLWTHKDRDSMPFVTGISVNMPHPEQWRKALMSDTLWHKYAVMGKGIIAQQKRYAKDVLKKRDKHECITHTGYKLLLQNVPPQWTNIVSDVINGESDYDGVLCYSLAGTYHQVALSLRTAADCELNAGQFMKDFFSGGGHKHAAGGRASSFGVFMRILDIIKDRKGCWV